MSSMQPVLAPKARHNLLPVFIGTLLALFIIGFAYLVLTSTPAARAPALRDPLAVNPELKSLALYGETAVSPLLAENPELISFERFMAQQEANRNALAVNPELTSMQRYAAALAAQAPPRNPLAVNPELISFQRYTNQ